MNRFDQKRASRPIGRRRNGATMIELVVVILIMGIMAGVAVPRYFDAMDQYRADAAAKRVQSDLGFAQRQAKLASKNRTVTFFIFAESYWISPIKNPNHPGKTFFGTPYYWVNLKETGYTAEIVSIDFGGGSSITFDRYGRPNKGGTVVVQSGSYQKTIAIDATTGRATIQ